MGTPPYQEEVQAEGVERVQALGSGPGQAHAYRLCELGQVT